MMSVGRLLAFALAATSALLGAATHAAPAAASPAVQVVMQHFKFCVNGDCNQATATVRVGDTVTWVYQDGNPANPPSCADFLGQCPGHTATSDSSAPARFSSPTLSQDGQTYSYSFTKPGTYNYYCVYHGGPNPNNPVTSMNGTIVVQAAPGAAPAPSPTQSAGAAATPGLPNSGAATPSLAAGAPLLAVVIILGLATRRRARS